MWADELIAELKNPVPPPNSITVNELTEKIGKSQATAQKKLLSLVKQGKLQRVRINKEWHYYE